MHSDVRKWDIDAREKIELGVDVSNWVYEGGICKLLL